MNKIRKNNVKGCINSLISKEGVRVINFTLVYHFNESYNIEGWREVKRNGNRTITIEIYDPESDETV